MISAIIAVYNCAGYVAMAIRSVLDQDCELEVEIVVVDDGSTDDLDAALAPFADRITLVRQRNQGVSAARNRGVAAASNPWIAFLDADDFWYPDRLRRQIEVIDRHPEVELVFSDFSVCDPDGGPILERGRTVHYPIYERYGVRWAEMVEHPSAAGSDGDVYIGDVAGSLFLGNYVKTSSVLLGRNAFEECGGFDVALRTQEDYELWLRVTAGRRVAYVDRPLICCRRRPDQLTESRQIPDIIATSRVVLERHEQAARRVLSDRLVDQRLVHKYMQQALVYLGGREDAKAREVLRHAWRRFPRDVRPLLLILWSFLPHALTEPLRRVRLAWRSRSGPAGTEEAHD